MEFGATYPINSEPLIENKKPNNWKGSFGDLLDDNSIPKYSLNIQKEFPKWKKIIIKKNREFYSCYKKDIDPILNKIKKLNIPSHQKLEWNIINGSREIKNYIIQFRGSGVRIKQKDYFPSLVTIRSQVPIVKKNDHYRYLTIEEGAKIQSLEGIELPKNKNQCYKALGNAVNALIAEKIFSNLLGLNRKYNK